MKRWMWITVVVVAVIVILSGALFLMNNRTGVNSYGGFITILAMR